MRIDLRALIFAIRSSFWLIPILLGLLALIVAIFVVESDFALQRRGLYIPSQWAMPVASARVALSTIAGSMITVATLVFSMTLVALTMVSRQLGPRVLLHFMDDRQTQVVLGLFIATFIFALIVLMHVGDEAVGDRVPGIAVAVTAGLAIMSLGMMIHFIHHIATRIQADVIIHELGDDLNRALSAFVQRSQDENSIPDASEYRSIDKLFNSGRERRLTLSRSGYLRRLDESGACSLAGEHGLIVKMLGRPGEFILAETPVAMVASTDKAEIEDETIEAVLGMFSAAPRRTPEASIEFEINALAEVALRALSPGVNDPYTAISCLYRLTDGMRLLMRRKSDRRISRDGEGAIRIVHREEPFSRYLSIAFDTMREAAGQQTLVLTELQRMLENLRSLASDEQVGAAIDRRMGAIRASLDELDSEPIEFAETDKNDKEERASGKKM